jgi:spore coat polysaccharide biosynthesis predicted glycosyltransferase SpsG/RimJ/RimL family protein N-acetyltransferase
MVIDDLANRPHECDVLLDQTLGRSEGDYRQLVPEACRLLLGTEYALLRPEFAWRRVAALRRRNEPRTRRILVSLGVTGPGGLIGTVLDGLSPLKLDAIDVVVGASYPDLHALQARAVQIGRHVRVLTDVKNMAELMEAADLAIGAAGSTCWERCCLGLPTVMIATAENQRTNAERLQAAGAARWLGFAGDVRADDITSSVSVLVGDQQSLGAISRAAASVCDGRGTNRVVSLLSPEVAKNGEPVLLRPAKLEDAQRIFEWQTIPGLRRFSRTPGAPTRDEHNRWMRTKLNDPNCLLSIVMLAGRPVGVLRLDRLETDSYEVSVLIAPIAQGIGVGRAALDCAAWLVPESRLWACISPENKVSQRLFGSAGYRYAETEIGAAWIREPQTVSSIPKSAPEHSSL